MNEDEAILKIAKRICLSTGLNPSVASTFDEYWEEIGPRKREVFLQMARNGYGDYKSPEEYWTDANPVLRADGLHP